MANKDFGVLPDNINYHQTVGARIRKIRTSLSLSMANFGSSVSPSTSSSNVSNWETNKAIPNQARLESIAELGNVSVAYILGLDSVPTRRGVANAFKPNHIVDTLLGNELKSITDLTPFEHDLISLQEKVVDSNELTGAIKIICADLPPDLVDEYVQFTKDSFSQFIIYVNSAHSKAPKLWNSWVHTEEYRKKFPKSRYLPKQDKDNN